MLRRASPLAALLLLNGAAGITQPLICHSRRSHALAPACRHPVPVLQAAPTATTPLAYEVVKGLAAEGPGTPPTAVLCHGILGSGRNLKSFATRLADKFPRWQFLLVDLRCHGGSTGRAASGEHSVAAAAQDVIDVLNHLKIYPIMLIGHSFGGKVVMSMVQLSGRVLPRPVQVWVLDTVPGDVFVDGGDHPRDTINFVRTLEMPLESRKQLVTSLTGAGFTLEGAQWMATNLKPVRGGSGGLDWTFDIEGIAQMYSSYEKSDLWSMLETKPKGCAVDFVRAERSAFLWTDEDVERIQQTSGVHLLRDSSHWVHIDNPDGLLDMMAPSFDRMERGPEKPVRER